ncbi:MAG: hypothetical protein ACETVU_04020 [Desulfatiglandales bacterium]
MKQGFLVRQIGSLTEKWLPIYYLRPKVPHFIELKVLPACLNGCRHIWKTRVR